MSLVAPSYIPAHLFQDIQPNFEWDEWDPYVILGEPDDNEMAKFSKLTYRAIISYTISCSEWVVFRFKEDKNVKIAKLFIEALWAHQMSEKVAMPPELNPKDWKGSSHMAIGLSLITVLNAIIQSESEIPDYDSAFNERIVLHVLPDTSSFLKWREKIFDKLNRDFFRHEDNTWGEPVPREYFDTNLSISEKDHNRLISDFLNNIDYENNIFIKLST